MFTLATNVCVNDDARIRVTLPHWVREFGDRLDEIVIAVDEQPRTSRMADAQHAVVAELAELDATLDSLRDLHPRIEVLRFDAATSSTAVSRKWFQFGEPVRCHSGSPIFGYLLALEAASNDLVLKVDCDMLFHEAGWLDVAAQRLRDSELDLVDPWRVGLAANLEYPVSTRAFLLDKSRIAERLPLEPRRLDPMRRLHRWLTGRPPWLALELTLGHSVRTGRMRAATLERELGFSLHVPVRGDFELRGFEAVVVAAVESGVLPGAQWRAGPDFCRTAWRDLA